MMVLITYTQYSRPLFLHTSEDERAIVVWSMGSGPRVLVERCSCGMDE